MKTIKVTDEMYAELMAISEKMNNQDHEGRRMPYLFHVAEEISEPTCEGCGTPVWVDCDGDYLRTKDEIIEYIAEYMFLDDCHYMCDATSADREFDSMIQATRIYESGEYEDYLEEQDFTLYNEEKRTRYSNGFFTRKACEVYIAQNSHNLHEPSCQLLHAYRNPEMETVSKFLCEISGGEIHL